MPSNCTTLCALKRVMHDPEMADTIRQTADPYEAKKLAKNIKITQISNETKMETMEKVIKLKFDQNDSIRDKLLTTTGKLYEATTDKFFGCGLTLAQYSSINQISITGKNRLGRLLEAYRNQYRA